MPLIHRTPSLARLAAAALLVALLSACGEDGSEVASTAPPEVGACRLLTPDDVAVPTNDTPPVPCVDRHTAETFEVGDLPTDLHDLEADDPAIGAWVFRTCSDSFVSFLRADESEAMRTVLSWVWFRPGEPAWEAGARWYRCDVVGGGEQLTDYRALPETAEGLLEDIPPDEWMVCAAGRTLTSGPKVPCSEPHRWRAVTTIKVGEPGDPYPGERAVGATSRDFCSDSVGAWLGYPTSYDFGFTDFGEAEWQAGNRRSVCWAKTQQ